jgi:hypothetical protein
MSRPKGLPKTGGRKKGTKNKKTIGLEAALARAVEAGVEPLEFLLAIMRDPAADYRVRLEAAKIACPYRHARLSQVDVNGSVGLTVVLSPEDASVL